MKRVIVWQRVDTAGAEYAEIGLSPLTLEGEVVLVEAEGAFAVSYRVDCDGSGMTKRAFVRCKREGLRTERVLERDSAGHWTMDGTRQPHLDGIADVDLSVTPSTNTSPIRRMQLAVGQHGEVIAAWLRFPSLELAPLRQIYRRVSPTLYEYRAPDHDFVARLECDAEGIVTVYGDLWKRSSWPDRTL
ncbi:MAG TPA: putative glycolipid-binding domain-containing protein [Polyangiaceae bacterium]